MKRILIVDDDRVTLTLLQKILSERGYKVLTAVDGEEGYQLAQEANPDLLISDMLIPKVDGLELCKNIKESPSLSQTKVILMTGVYKGVTFKFEAKDVGADDFVEKPLDRNDLIKRVEFLIGKREEKPENTPD